MFVTKKKYKKLLDTFNRLRRLYNENYDNHFTLMRVFEKKTTDLENENTALKQQLSDTLEENRLLQKTNAQQEKFLKAVLARFYSKPHKTAKNAATVLPMWLAASVFIHNVHRQRFST